MDHKQINKTAFRSLKTKPLGFWFFVRIISAFGPIILTYVFAKGVEALENGEGFDAVIHFFVIYLVVSSVAHFLRIGSKTRISAHAEVALIEVRDNLTRHVSAKSEHRREYIQTVRNYTQALRAFIIFFNESGIQGVVSFITIPFLLFFIDTKVFVLEMLLIGFYIIVTVYMAKHYEKNFEQFDKSREYYFSSLLTNKDNTKEAEYVKTNKFKVENSLFLNWTVLQNIISVFEFVIIFIVLKDVFAGVKQISDLILIGGYTKESKTFLNQTSSSIEKFTAIEAAAERIATVAEKDGLVLHLEAAGHRY